MKMLALKWTEEADHTFHTSFFGSENRILSSQTVKLKQNVIFNLELHILSHFDARFRMKDDL